MAKPNGCKEHFWKEKGCKYCEALQSGVAHCSPANSQRGTGPFSDEEAQKILSFFTEAGMTFELGATYSARGQIAQLLNGCMALLAHVERDSLA